MPVFKHFLLAFVTLSVGVSAAPKKTKFNWHDTKHVIAFGDSYTYVQGTAGRQNSTFIGDYFNFSFTEEELLHNKIVQNQTATAEGGPNWVEYLTGCGLKPGLTSPLSCKTQLWDFAFGGADISTKYTPRHHNYTVMLEEQVQQFLTYAQPTLSKIVDPSKTLVAFWIGINDINDSANYSVDFPSFYDQLISTLFASVQSVYDIGYRNFLFMNLPPLDRTPGNVLKATPSPNTTMINWWDSSLTSHMHTFAANNPSANPFTFDVNTFLNNVLDHPDKYNIKNVTGYCASYNQPYINQAPESYGCLPLDEYAWFNNGHMTSHVHEILAKEVAQFLKKQ
ncbi:lysophospholipase A [Aureobasidium pullulans]|uniref:Lysophospholipase A n=2 Tax=Aureobasidium pullulans TaxID=5580 RepID=A0A4S9ZFF0_AURPU|nr:lysophospholipase A [Aureobasidium pullulans]THW65702.1 lysophospholipase A [Aureobasidium pullulans]THZ32649.1 lysophospholipase A [Aureobasidium pullulans]TIA05436.1 lysophospholipase A [Aureobasidium pullulans]